MRTYLIALLLAGALASPASATTIVIGPGTPLNDQGYVQCSPLPCSQTFAQLTQPTAGAYLTTPADGTVVQWRVHGDTFGDGSLRLRIVRPTFGGYAGGSASSEKTASEGDGAPAHVTSLPIGVGDGIGIDAHATTGGTDKARVYTTTPSGAGVGIWNPQLVASGPGVPPSSQVSTRRLQLNATVELSVPAIDALAPSGDLSLNGGPVRILGRHLANATRVRFGGADVPILSDTNTEIQVTAPAHVAGGVPVVVSAPGGDSAAGTFTYGAASTPGGGGGGGPGPGTDRTAPVLSKLRLAPSTFLAANVGPSAIATAAVGTQVVYRDSEAATTSWSIDRRSAGHLSKHRCAARAPRKGSKQRRCTRWTKLRGGFTRRDVAGLNAFRFMGRLRGKSLRPGHYRLVVVAKDAARNASKSARRSFAITA